MNSRDAGIANWTADQSALWIGFDAPCTNWEEEEMKAVPVILVASVAGFGQDRGGVENNRRESVTWI